MYTNDKVTLCNRHNTITYWLRELRKLLKKKKKEVDLDLSYEFELISNMLNEVKKAKASGQAMENQLVRYRRGIEALDYRRVHKGKIQPKV